VHSLESALNQTLLAKEIIIIDDNSSTDYSAVLKKFNDSRVRYIKQAASGGANVARNLGVKESSGDVVAFLDDDDVWLPDYLKEHKTLYEEGADAVVSGFKHLGNEREVRVNSDKKVTKKSLLKGNKYCGMSGFSCKKHVLITLNFDEKLNNGQDWDLFVRLYLRGFTFCNISKPIFLYRFQNPDGIGAKLRSLDPADIEKRLGSARKHKAFLGTYWFNSRVAEQALFSLNHRKDKLRWILVSLRYAGPIATIRFFYISLSRKFIKYTG
tara:strand:- start:8423 stop:9229 length:807 start_codon:yes stop_codon:yes gene_type:complete